MPYLIILFRNKAFTRGLAVYSKTLNAWLWVFSIIGRDLQGWGRFFGCRQGASRESADTFIKTATAHILSISVSHAV